MINGERSMNPFAFVVLFLQNEKARVTKVFNKLQKVKNDCPSQILTPKHRKVLEKRLACLEEYDVACTETIAEGNGRTSKAIVRLNQKDNTRDYHTMLKVCQSDIVQMTCSCGFPQVYAQSLTICLCVIQFVSLLTTLSVFSSSGSRHGMLSHFKTCDKFT